jgi:hypothetical protein
VERHLAVQHQQRAQQVSRIRESANPGIGIGIGIGAGTGTGTGTGVQAIINQEAAAQGKSAIASQFGALVRLAGVGLLTKMTIGAMASGFKR